MRQLIGVVVLIGAAACTEEPSPQAVSDLESKSQALTEGTAEGFILKTGEGEPLLNGETVIWREPARWEGYERFEQILVILKKKYGKHLRHLIPTQASVLYLHGDRLWTPEAVQQLRQELE